MPKASTKRRRNKARLCCQLAEDYLKRATDEPSCGEFEILMGYREQCMEESERVWAGGGCCPREKWQHRRPLRDLRARGLRKRILWLRRYYASFVGDARAGETWCHDVPGRIVNQMCEARYGSRKAQSVRRMFLHCDQ